MLKQIPPVLSPDLFHILMRMGHGDELVLADANFPAETRAQRLVRADGLEIPVLLRAILQFLPLDTFVEEIAFVMQPVEPEAAEPIIWQNYRALLAQAEGRPVPLTLLPREEFYTRAESAFAIVATSERTIYGNLILKKGVVPAA